MLWLRGRVLLLADSAFAGWPRLALAAAEHQRDSELAAAEFPAGEDFAEAAPEGLVAAGRGPLGRAAACEYAVYRLPITEFSPVGCRPLNPTREAGCRFLLVPGSWSAGRRPRGTAQAEEATGSSGGRKTASSSPTSGFRNLWQHLAHVSRCFAHRSVVLLAARIADNGRRVTERQDKEIFSDGGLATPHPGEEVPAFDHDSRPASATSIELGLLATPVGIGIGGEVSGIFVTS